MGIFSAFLMGISAGSFINLCGCRIPKGEGVILGSSRCPFCGRRIWFRDMIPLLGYIRLKGRCRFCNGSISLRYPMVELATGTIWLLLYIKCGNGTEFLRQAVFVSILIVAGIIDFDTGDVYTSVTLLGILAGMALLIPVQGWWPDHIFAAAVGYGFIAAIATLGGMGWGDAEVCLLCGLFLGMKSTLIMLLLSFIMGGAAGIMLIVLGKMGSGARMPFVPFMALSSIITLLFGEQVIKYILNLQTIL